MGDLRRPGARIPASRYTIMIIARQPARNSLAANRKRPRRISRNPNQANAATQP